MNILHLVRDEKFMLFFDSVFSKIPSVQNRYIVLGDKNKPFKYIDGLDVWRRVSNGYFISSSMTKDLAWADCLVVHLLEFGGVCMILRAPPNVTTVWSGWGVDYYRYLPGGEGELLGKETTELMDYLDSNRDTNTIGIRNCIRSLKYEVTERLRKLAIHKVNLFSAPIKNDFVLLKQALGEHFNAEYTQLNYVSVERTFMSGMKSDEGEIGNNILIGNSASATNNHIEAFYLLSACELNDRKVIVPLSYGDPEYRDAVIEKGKEILGSHFVPIVQFIPLEKYNKFISQCSIVIMNHCRQQALGTIGIMLYRGAKVFLDEKNPVYGFFQENGAHIYSTDLFREGVQDVFVPLNNAQIEKNRAMLESYWGHDVVMRNAHDLVEKIKTRRSQYA